MRVIIGFWIFSFLFSAEESFAICSNDDWHRDLASRALSAQFLYENPSLEAHRESMRVYINNMKPEEAYLADKAINDDDVSNEVKSGFFSSIIRREGDTSEELDPNAFGALAALRDLHRETYELVMRSACVEGCKIESDLEDEIINYSHLYLRNFVIRALKSKSHKRKPQGT